MLISTFSDPVSVLTSILNGCIVSKRSDSVDINHAVLENGHGTCDNTRERPGSQNISGDYYTLVENYDICTRWKAYHHEGVVCQ